VCGLPNPNRSHAVVMAKFARDCVVKMQQQLADLETTLGSSTRNLGIRIGLHSGPITAGVLRGEKYVIVSKKSVIIALAVSPS
jgi:class 3 adenylate cyclase